MIIFVAFVGIVVCVALCYWWVKAIVTIFDWLEKKINGTDVNNPYIKAHLSKKKGDTTYQEYLKWLDKNGGDMPLEKLKTKEELEFDRKLERAHTQHEIKTMFKRK